jgi:hypothetical protein
MPNEPQPLPPVYEPELAAEAIIWAAEHDRPELNVGGVVDAAILLDRVAPGLLDRYLAATAYEGQQTATPVDPARVDNLEAPLAGDHRVHGIFGDQAKPTSRQFWATTHRPVVVGAAASIAALLIMALRRSR